jgi:hypothetical protein
VDKKSKGQVHSIVARDGIKEARGIVGALHVVDAVVCPFGFEIVMHRFWSLLRKDAKSQWRCIFGVRDEVAEGAVELNVNEKFLVIISLFLF